MSSPTDAPNEAMRAFWDSDASAAWVDQHERYDRELAPYLDAVLAAAGLRPDERVLDIGCGTGSLCLAAAQVVGPHHVRGVDLSGPMLAKGRQRMAEAGLDAVELFQADAQVHPFLPAGADVVVSRFGVMFFDDPVAAFTNLHRAVALDGRLAVAVWQDRDRNPWMSELDAAVERHVPQPEPPDPAGPGPLSLADPDTVRGVLGEAGWRDVALAPCEPRMLLGGGGTVDEVLAFFVASTAGRRVLAPSPSPQATADALAEVRAVLEARATDGRDPTFESAAWIVTARR
jgi:SAM-dependent methyltransferase